MGQLSLSEAKQSTANYQQNMRLTGHGFIRRWQRRKEGKRRRESEIGRRNTADGFSVVAAGALFSKSLQVRHREIEEI